MIERLGQENQHCQAIGAEAKLPFWLGYTIQIFGSRIRQTQKLVDDGNERAERVY